MGVAQAEDAPKDATTESAQRSVYRWVAESPRKLTASDLGTRISSHFACSRHEAGRMIRSLVAQGRLGYVYLYGQSYIDLSFRRPTPISRQVVLYPPECTEVPAAGQHAIIIAPGAAFGDGRHPTTRLAVEGLASIWHSSDGPPQPAFSRGIDIGTGSGILAIAAARFGVARVDALDIDPCALSEARLNIDHNRLGHRISLQRQPLEALEAMYDLIIANLRLPTLCSIAAWVDQHANPDSRLVVSGFREPELAALQGAFPEPTYSLRWSAVQAGWCGAVFQNNRAVGASRAVRG